MEGSGTLEKSLEFSFPCQKNFLQVSGIQWIHLAECRTFQNPCIDLYLAYDIILGTSSLK